MMKQVCIVTVYNSENAGSYLQAYALMRAITKMGYKACFYRRSGKDTSHSLKLTAINLIKCALKGRYKRGRSFLRRYWAFERAHSKLTTVHKLPQSVGLVIFGSDTLWNFKDSYFREHAHFYLGCDFPSIEKITYAISAGNTEFAEFAAIENITEALQGFRALGVRDAHTDALIQSVDEVRTVRVCDPTMLLTSEEYNDLCLHKAESRYLLIYYFGKIDKDLRGWIEAYAARKKLAVINLGIAGDRDWCKTVGTTPSSFVTYFRNAEFIVTNTFHGTAFAINFGRQFIAYTSDKIKVIELMTEYGLIERTCSCVSEIDKAIKDPIKYAEVNSQLEKVRKASQEFLKETLEAVCEE